MNPKTTIKTSILILACILLAGVILMAVGFYQQDSLLINIGVPLTLITSLLITIQNVTSFRSNAKR